jgi:hypothetical protein
MPSSPHLKHHAMFASLPSTHSCNASTRYRERLSNKVYTRIESPTGNRTKNNEAISTEVVSQQHTELPEPQHHTASQPASLYVIDALSAAYTTPSASPRRSLPRHQRRDRPILQSEPSSRTANSRAPHASLSAVVHPFPRSPDLPRLTHHRPPVAQHLRSTR